MRSFCPRVGPFYALITSREANAAPTVSFGDVIEYAPVNGPVNGIFHVLYETVEDDDRMFHHETHGIDARPTTFCVSPTLLASINAGIADETSDIRRLVSWPIRRVFVYVDVSDFSTMPPGQQALVINSIINIVDKDAWETSTPRNYEAKLCIGDGYIFVFRDTMDAIRFAGQFAMLVEVLGAKRLLPVEFHFRMGMHIGDVYCFWDTVSNGWNYIGDGINGGQRVLAAVGKESDDVVFVSEQVRRQVITQNPGTTLYRMVLHNMHSKGRKPDKHGRLWRVFEVNPRAFTTLKAAFQQ